MHLKIKKWVENACIYFLLLQMKTNEWYLANYMPMRKEIVWKCLFLTFKNKMNELRTAFITEWHFNLCLNIVLKRKKRLWCHLFLIIIYFSFFLFPQALKVGECQTEKREISPPPPPPLSDVFQRRRKISGRNGESHSTSPSSSWPDLIYSHLFAVMLMTGGRKTRRTEVYFE